ncbi:MAG TPA: lipopolysaccharide kinase InaA family protein [Thermodesulfobacteriota bacterium]|nr:hypothetical protein [Deltaproteobacteria bacterium]HNR11843.1 lipopolysaccharide kinase InaA family protein [Thermodesulfobacteriota bacterium]HNU70102.1 lipopolysaccharide kinase InaA family protein [Thermodesulfobacteriota bacterium]
MSSEILICQTLMRHVPGRRMVCRAEWEGAPVAVKLLFDKHRSKRHWLRQERGICALMTRNVFLPLPVYSGRYQSDRMYPPNGYCVVFRFVAEAITLEEAWRASETPEEQKQLLEQVIPMLASLHEKGVIQSDLHLKNFLLQGTKMHLLDYDSISVSNEPLGKQISLTNLGLFFAQFPPWFDGWVNDLVKVYASSRGWQNVEAGASFLLRIVDKCRKRRARRVLKKIFRESSSYCFLKEWNLNAVYSRSLCFGNGAALVRNPDALISEEERGNLKKGNTSTVTAAMVSGEPLVIKRYNIKNLFHGFSRSLRPSRAARSWENAHRLALLDIATAPPQAFIEKRIGPIRRESFFITSLVKGENCLRFFHNDGISPAEQVRVAEKIAALFRLLARYRISHGDLKATNILIAADSVILIDLDAMREHRFLSSFQKAFQADLRRFLKNWDELPDVKRLFANTLADLLATYHCLK